MRRGVEHRRVPVAGGVTGGEDVFGHTVRLGQDAARGVGVEVGERALTEDRMRSTVGGPEDLEQVELEIAQVALVMAHPGSTPRAVCYRAVTKAYYPLVMRDNCLWRVPSV